MTEEVPAVSGMANGSVSPGTGPLQVTGVIGETGKPVGTAPYANAESNPEGNQEEHGDPSAEELACGGCDGERQCEEKREEQDGTLQQGPADTQPMGPDGQESEEGPGSEGTAASPGGEPVGTLHGSTCGRGNPAQEQEEEDAEDEEEEEEEDTEEDEVQVIEIKKENSETSRLEQHDGDKEVSPPTSPGCNSQAETAGEQLSLGKKTDISRHSYSRYNTISYRRIRKGNTKQRIDEFESMMHL
ncbi:ERMIN protein, partial [Heliornis fulica]|nr:ERMIN protein [Heliornis fulica]